MEDDRASYPNHINTNTNMNTNMTKPTIANLCAAYNKEHEHKEVDFDNPDDFYVGTHFPDPLMSAVAADLTPQSLLEMLKGGMWLGDDSFMDLTNLYKYSFARGLLARGFGAFAMAWSCRRAAQTRLEFSTPHFRKPATLIAPC